MIRKIDHIGIAVKSLEDALKVYEGSFSLALSRIENVPAHKTRVAMLPVGESRIELLEATAENSSVARFIAKRGEGLHHVCFQVENLSEEIRRLKAAGARLVDEEPRPGAEGRLVAFVHPSSTGGVLVELAQPISPKPKPSSK